MRWFGEMELSDWRSDPGQTSRLEGTEIYVEVCQMSGTFCKLSIVLSAVFDVQVVDARVKLWMFDMRCYTGILRIQWQVLGQSLTFDHAVGSPELKTFAELKHVKIVLYNISSTKNDLFTRKFLSQGSKKAASCIESSCRTLSLRFKKSWNGDRRACIRSLVRQLDNPTAR